MSNQTSWLEGNSNYLTAAVAWLRLLLEVDITLPRSSARKQAQGMREVPGGTITAEQITRKAVQMAAVEKSMKEEPPALVKLSKRLQLSRFEQDVLFLCTALELDTRIPALCAQAQDAPNQPYPTFALAMALFADPSWDALSPERPLRRLQLIEISQAQERPVLTSGLRADERVAHYIKGLSSFDERLASFMVSVEVAKNQLEVSPSQQRVVQTIRQSWQQAWHRGASAPVVQLVGPDAPSKQLIASRAASESNHRLYRMSVTMLPAGGAELERLARLWRRESLLLQSGLYLDAQDVDSTTPLEGYMLSLNRFLAHSDGIFFLATRENWPRLERAHRTLDVERPTLVEQQSAWANSLGELAGHIPPLLAGQFDLNLATIQQIGQSACDEMAGDAQTLPDRLWDACRVSTRPQLDILAQRLDPKATWDDIVLPVGETRMLQQIVDQVGQRSKVYETWGFAHKMNRGLGISALFAGESGTGKTMAAVMIANALRLNLYRIDLSAVVSKYIGETEKNLRRLFDAAESGGAILFFDEADALFGKRSEVKESHDRYANIEINYLLQRMEAYRGLAILATNMKSALDVAFMRRLRFIINFPFPGSAERRLMWQKVFPADTPISELDYDHLARLNLTGGSIHNIALNAAFLAAAQEKQPVVTMPLVLAAARAEFRKLERPLREADLQWPGRAGAGQGVKA